MNLVIVESPAKGRTIEKYLGKDYRVVASFGHVRDLPKNELGVDVEKDFTPKYVTPPKARKTISSLKELASKSNNIYLATDYDREGEAIAWHVAQAIGLKNLQKVPRITFHEITKDAILNAVKNPRSIDMNLVDAQQARRVLDRLVGYKLSPFLWKKLYKGLSAGRVQSVAVRLIVDRENEIKKFTAQEYWLIAAKLKKDSQEFEANLTLIDGKKLNKLDISDENQAQSIIDSLKNSQYQVKSIEEKQENRWPYPPFTTSTMQQEASYKLGFSAKKTMKLAQNLYESGLITYMRTDSTNLSSLAINSCRKLIESQFGKNYLPLAPKVYKTKTKGAQEAHEAIRPTFIEDLSLSIEKLNGKADLTEDHKKLFELIWRRMIACQMEAARIKIITAQIEAKGDKLYTFVSRGASIEFDGFTKIWPTKISENTLPQMKIDDLLEFIELIKSQHFTEPPARYSEATLIKTLEEKGIGRPSTYAPILSTIQDRGYVVLEKRYFHPQEIGFLVTDLLVKYFPDIVDIGFTAKMEQNFDEVAEGKDKWTKIIGDFYYPFEKNLEDKYEKVEKVKFDSEVDVSEEKCPKCGKPMIVKMGRFGKFLACSGFPECKTTKQIINSTGLKCPECKKGDILERKTRKGKTFWGCSLYPKCKWASWDNPKGK